MPGPKTEWVPIADFTGGRDGANDPINLPDTVVAEARNGDFYRTKGFRKDPGSTTPSIGSAFTGKISSLALGRPTDDPAANELWGVDDAATPIIGRMAAATTFSSVTTKDDVASNETKVRFFDFNQKLWVLFDSTADRSHVYDPDLSSPSIRRAGLATPSAPTVANTGSGSYAATERWYRQRYQILDGTRIVCTSEPSVSVAFTPSGSGTDARITKATTISESETHWMLEASDDNVTFFELIRVVVGTTTHDDSAAVSSYASGTISAVVGAFTVPISAKYGMAFDNRVLLAGGWESGAAQSRLFYSAAFGTGTRGDDERIPETANLKNRKDLDEGGGGGITGFGGVVYGSAWIFKYKQIWKATSTTNAGNPLDLVKIDDAAGAIEQEMIALGKDAQSRPTIYFADPDHGPMAISGGVAVEIGQGIRDHWDDVNLAATTVVGWVLYYHKIKQVWFAFAKGSDNVPTVLAKYHIATGGWSIKDTGGLLRTSLCAALLPRTPGSSMSRDLVPYLGASGTNNSLHRADTSDTSDDGTTYQALIKTRVLNLNNGKPFEIHDIYVLAKVSSGVTLTVTVIIDFGLTPDQTGTVTLGAAGSETHIFKRVEGIDVGHVQFGIQVQIGDASAVANAWQVERLYVPSAQVKSYP